MTEQLHAMNQRMHGVTETADGSPTKFQASVLRNGPTWATGFDATPPTTFTSGRPSRQLTAVYDAAHSAIHQVTGAQAPERSPRAGGRTSRPATAPLASPPSPRPSLTRSARIIDALGTRLAAAFVDRVTFSAHILETGTQSYRLRISRTGRTRNRKPT
jgi:hypothetical protein